MVTIQEEAKNYPEIEQKESIKLIKNTRGYNYEVRILSLDVKRLKQITDEIEETYNLNKMEVN